LPFSICHFPWGSLVLGFSLLISPTANQAQPITLTTSDHLALTFTDDGGFAQVTVRGEEVPLAGPGGWFIRDVGRAGEPRSIPLPVEAETWEWGEGWQFIPEAAPGGAAAARIVRRNARAAAELRKVVPVEPDLDYTATLEARWVDIQGSPPVVVLEFRDAAGEAVGKAISLTAKRDLESDTAGEWFPLEGKFKTPAEARQLVLSAFFYQGWGTAEFATWTLIGWPSEPDSGQEAVRQVIPVDETWEGVGWTRREAAGPDGEPTAWLTFSGFSDSLRKVIPVQPRTSYRLSLQAQILDLQGNPPVVILTQHNAAGEVLQGPALLPYPTPTNLGTWQPLTGTLTTGPATTHLSLSIFFADGLGAAQFGGLELEEYPPGERMRLPGRLTPTSEGASFTAEDPQAELRLHATFQAEGEALQVEGRLEDTSGQERAVTLTFALPVAAEGWRWWDDLNRSRRMGREGVYENWQLWGAGHLVSRYPLACLDRDGAALTLAVPPDAPAVFRLAQHQGLGFGLSFDFGLTPATAKFPQAAPFRFRLYRVPSGGGFREALRRYYDQFPDAFVQRVEREGLWFSAVDPEQMPDPESWGLCFDERAGEHPDWAQAHQLYGLETLLPWGHTPADPAVPNPTAEDPSAFYNEAQQPYLLDPLSPDQAAFVPVNADPDLRSPHAPIPGLPLAGFFLDATASAWSGWDLDNYRRDHFAAADFPLTFSVTTRRPVQLATLAQAEFVRALAADLHGRGQLLMANAPPGYALTVIAPWLDVIGGSEGRGDLPEPDFALLRATAFQRPVAVLDVGLMDPKRPLLEKQALFERCLLWGVFPGPPVWADRRQFGPLRPLFQHYLPLLRELATAGWEPVTQAESSDATIRVERFGRGRQTHFVLYNPGLQERTTRLSINGRALDWPETMPALREMGSDRTCEIRAVGSRWELDVRVPGQRAVVLKWAEKAKG